jgi:hypothetical protein
MLEIVFLVSLESSQPGKEGCAWAWFHDVWTFGQKKFLNIEWFFHWKLNSILTENFRVIGMCLWSFWTDLDEEDEWNLFDKIWMIHNVGDILIFKWFVSLKIQINSKKYEVLEGKISWGRGNTWAKGTGHTLIIYIKKVSEGKRRIMKFKIFHYAKIYNLLQKNPQQETKILQEIITL